MTGLVAVDAPVRASERVCGCKGQARRAQGSLTTRYITCKEREYECLMGVRALLARYLPNGTYQAMDGDSALCQQTVQAWALSPSSLHCPLRWR